jgi:hypothetical protein|tara:strand:+ start:9 stop:290 length:282 start_codon:yes stop_codon:yes gene_type:complete
MSDFKNHGKATIFHNEDANEENKRPNLSGSIEITEDIPKGTVLRIAGWTNYQGSVIKSVGMNLSSKVGGEDNTYKKQTSGQSYEVKKDEDIPF